MAVGIPRCTQTCASSSSFRTATKAPMASILRRQFARASRPLISQRLSARCLSTSTARKAEPARASASAERRESALSSAQAQGESSKSFTDFHTVEDLQGMTALDLLSETGTRKDGQMRHFTGTYFIRFDVEILISSNQ